MARDWYATFLTDARAMEAARDRANRHGEDGWSAAYTVALTLPPAPGSHAATGARDVLVPDTLPDASELVRLADATPADPAAAGTYGGYYNEPNIDFDNHDMAPSMTRRARDGEVVRPDLKCSSCCATDGEPEQAGVQEQTYRCTRCHGLWNYVPAVDSDESDGGCCRSGQCLWCRLRGQLGIYTELIRDDAHAVRMLDFMRGVTVLTQGPDGELTVAPLPQTSRPGPPEPSWLWPGMVAPDPATPGRSWPAWGEGLGMDSDGMAWFIDESAELFGPARNASITSDVQRAANARMVAAAFGIPEHLVRGETDEEYRRRVEAEATDLLVLLHMVSAGQVTVTRVDSYPAAPEARRRRLVAVGGAELGTDRTRDRRMQLTALGRVTYRELRHASLARGRGRHG